MVNKVHPPTPAPELVERVAEAAIAVHADSDNPLAVIQNMKPIPFEHGKMPVVISFEEQVYSLKMAGYTTEQIAHHMTIELKRDVTDDDIDEALEKVSTKKLARTAKQLQFSAQLELDRIEAALKAFWPAVEEGNLQATDRFIKLSQEKRKMLGLDSPDVSVSLKMGGADTVDLSALTIDELRQYQALQRKVSDAAKELANKPAAKLLKGE